MPGTEFNGWVNVKPFGNKRNKYGKLTIGGGFNGGHNQIDYSVASGYIGYHHKNFGQILRLPLQMAITVQEVLAQTKLVVGLQQLDGN